MHGWIVRWEMQYEDSGVHGLYDSLESAMKAVFDAEKDSKHPHDFIYSIFEMEGKETYSHYTLNHDDKKGYFWWYVDNCQVKDERGFEVGPMKQLFIGELP